MIRIVNAKGGKIVSSGAPDNSLQQLAAELDWLPTRGPSDPTALERLNSYLRDNRESLRERQMAVEFSGIDIDLRGADVSGVRWAYAWLNGANLEGVILRGANLRGAQLQGSVLVDADLREAHMYEAELDYATCHRAQLQGARLWEASALEADLRDASLRGADLDSALLRSADLRRSDLREAKAQSPCWLVEARLGGARVAGMRAVVRGPVDVSESDTPRWLDGEALEKWFSDSGARVDVIVDARNDGTPGA